MLKSLSSRTRRQGLTLMELVVRRWPSWPRWPPSWYRSFRTCSAAAHKATDATQTAEVSKAIQLYQGAYVSYPDDFDLLTDGTATAIDYLPTHGLAFGGFATPQSLTADEIKALAASGSTTCRRWPRPASPPATQR